MAWGWPGDGLPDPGRDPLKWVWRCDFQDFRLTPGAVQVEMRQDITRHFPANSGLRFSGGSPYVRAQRYLRMSQYRGGGGWFSFKNI